jgi:putative ABC transport system substrate-binding protein
MRRREFITAVGGAAAWPVLGHAQQKPRVGVLMLFDENEPITHADAKAFARALERFGWIDDSNIRIDYRFAANDAALFKKCAAEVVGLLPQAILASTPPALEALRQ